jgi:hypothetical protein
MTEACKHLEAIRDVAPSNSRHALGVIVAAPRKHAHAITLAPADEAEAIVLDPMHPLGPGRHGLAEGRQAGLDKTGRVASGRGERQSMCGLHNWRSYRRRVAFQGMIEHPALSIFFLMSDS